MRRPGPAATSNVRIRRRALVASALTVALVGATIGAVPATAKPRPTIAEVQARVAELNGQAEHAAEAYNAGQIELDQARVDQARSDRTLRQARRNLDLHRTEIGIMASQAYRGGGEAQGSLAVLMTAKDPKAVFEKLSTIDVLQRGQATTLRRIKAAQQGFTQAQAEAAQRTAHAQALAAELSKKKAAVTSLLSQAQAQLAQLTAEERARIEAARQAKAKADAVAAAKYLADQRVKAAAAARAAARARPTPSKSSSNNGGSNATAPPTSSQGKGKAAGAVQAALSKLGSPYVWAAAGPNTFDCSGLILWAYAQVGISVPHYTGAIWGGYKHVSKSELQPGDIVFFYSDVHHAGIYLGGGKMVHAPQTGDVVKISPAFWGRDYTGAVRIVG